MKKISIDFLLYLKIFFWADYPNVLVSTSFYLSNWGDVILSTYFINIFYQQMPNANPYPNPNPNPNHEKNDITSV